MNFWVGFDLFLYVYSHLYSLVIIQYSMSRLFIYLNHFIFVFGFQFMTIFNSLYLWVCFMNYPLLFFYYFMNIHYSLLKKYLLILNFFKAFNLLINKYFTAIDIKVHLLELNLHTHINSHHHFLMSLNFFKLHCHHVWYLHC